MKRALIVTCFVVGAGHCGDTGFTNLTGEKFLLIGDERESLNAPPASLSLLCVEYVDFSMLNAKAPSVVNAVQAVLIGAQNATKSVGSVDETSNRPKYFEQRKGVAYSLSRKIPPSNCRVQKVKVKNVAEFSWPNPCMVADKKVCEEKLAKVSLADKEKIKDWTFNSCLMTKSSLGTVYRFAFTLTNKGRPDFTDAQLMHMTFVERDSKLHFIQEKPQGTILAHIQQKLPQIVGTDFVHATEVPAQNCAELERFKPKTGQNDWRPYGCIANSMQSGPPFLLSHIRFNSNEVEIHMAGKEAGPTGPVFKTKSYRLPLAQPDTHNGFLVGLYEDTHGVVGALFYSAYLGKASFVQISQGETQMAQLSTGRATDGE